MKSRLAFILALFLVIGIAGCTGGNGENPTTTVAPITTTTTAPTTTIAPTTTVAAATTTTTLAPLPSDGPSS